MEDSSEEEWRIQEFRPPDEDPRSRQMWSIGLNIGKKIALTGMIVSALPLALPPLVFLSAFGVAFTVPFGFYSASYAATDIIMTTLLSKLKLPMLPLLLPYGEDEAENACEYNYDKVGGDCHQQQTHLQVEDKEWEDDASRAIESRIELEENENNETHGDEKDIADAIVGKFEQEEYEESLPSMVSDIPLIRTSVETGVGEFETAPSMVSEIPSISTSVETGVGESKTAPSMVSDEIPSIRTSVETDVGESKTAPSIPSIRTSVETGVGESKTTPSMVSDEIPSIRTSVETGVGESKTAPSMVSEIPSIRTSVETGVDESKTAPSMVPEIPSIRTSVETGVGQSKTAPSMVSQIPSIRPSVETGVGETKTAPTMVSAIPSIRTSVETGVGESKTAPSMVSEIPSIKTSVETGVGQSKTAPSMDSEIPSIRTSVETGVGESKTAPSMVPEIPSIVSSVEMGVGEFLAEKVEPHPRTASEIPRGIREADQEISSVQDRKREPLGNGVDVFDAEDHWPKMKFGDVEPEELEKESVGMIESIRDEGRPENKDHERAKEEVLPDEIIRDLDRSGPVEGMLVDADPVGSKIENPDWKAHGDEISLADELEQMKSPSRGETFIAVAGLEECSGPLSVIRKNYWIDDEVAPSKDGIRDTRHDAIMSAVTGEQEPGNDEVAPSQDEIRDARHDAIMSAITEEQEPGNDEVAPSQDEIRDARHGAIMSAITEEQEPGNEEVAPSQDEIRNARHDAIMSAVTEEQEPGKDFTRYHKDLQGIRSESLDKRNAKEEEGEGRVRVRKLVVRVNKSSKTVHKETDSNTKGETVIIMRAQTRETSSESELTKVQDFCHGHFATEDPRGMYLESSDTEDANLGEQELPESKPIKGVVNEISVRKQMNALRSIVGYEGPPNASCAEELKALYVFTGVEPPPSFGELSSMADVGEKLVFLMAVVGVKE